MQELTPKNLTVKHKPPIILEQYRRKSRELELGKKFLNLTSNVQSVEGRIDKFDSIKFEHFFSAKDPIKG